MPGRRRAIRVAIGLSLSVIMAGAGCSLVTSFEGFGCDGPCLDAAPSDGGASDAAADSSDDCAHTRWPPPPSGATDPTELTAITAVAALAAFGDLDGGDAAIGYDLDGVCTCPAPGSCRNATSDAATCDEPNTGRDFAFRSTLLRLRPYGLTFDDNGLNRGLKSGQYGLVFRLDEYNGKPDDGQVSFSIYDAIGVEGFEAGAQPTYDGNDTWTLDVDSIRGGVGTIPAYVDRTAYVTGGVLVANLDVVLDVIVYTGASDLILPLDVRAAHVTARIRPVAGGFALDDGLLAGRVMISSLLTASAALGYCPGSAVYEAFRPLLCAAADVNHDPAHDVAADAPCDGLSSVLAFRTVPAKIGSAAKRSPLVLACADAGACP
jgi:hypothetical protein